MSRKRHHKKKHATKKKTAQATAASQARQIAPTKKRTSVIKPENSLSTEKASQIKTMGMLALALLLLLIAGALVLVSLKPGAEPLPSSKLSPVPLNSTGNSNQLQSGSVDLQSGANPGSPSNNQLQPQTSVRPEDRQGLQ
ncbi:hypothetical protein KBC99_03400 [Candidatus Saccharibacteria bacterium]|nr:hypothetical protein [Candidatus Saccharibacteria bacterium]